MLQKLWPILLLICLLNSSCKTAPKISICVSDPSRGVFDCYSEETGQAFTLTYANSDKYVAMSPDDAKKLLDYCSSEESKDGTR